MASTRTKAERIDSSSTSMLSFMDDFSHVAEVWDTLSESARVSLSLEWDHMMADYLTELDGHCCAGLMTVNQQTQYHELLKVLTEAGPTIEQLELFRPALPSNYPMNELQ